MRMYSRKQKVLIVHNYYQIPGGEDIVVVNEKKLLEEHGHEVVLYIRDNSELKEMFKIKKLLLPFTTVFNLKTYREIKSIIREQNIDVVHVHNILNLISPAVYYAAYFCKVPVVQTIHNFRLLCPGATFYREGHICEDCVGQGLKCAVKHSCYRGSKTQTLACVVSTLIHRMLGIYGKLYYICLTEFNKDKLLGLKQISSDKIFIKPNFVENSESLIPYEQRAEQFVFVGRLDKLKGINILLEAWKQMGNTAPKLLVCGTGPMENWCKGYISENLLSNVEMLGFVPNIEAIKIIANSKALILPTQWYEGFPMTILEAYSVGTPVIGSDIGNVGSVIEEGVTGWKFQSNSPVELIAAINKNKDLSQNIFSFYTTNFSKESNYNLLTNIYTKCCKSLDF